MPSALCAQLTRDLFAIAKFLYKVQIEDHSVDDRVRMIRYGRIWFPLVLSLLIPEKGDRWINKTIVNNF